MALLEENHEEIALQCKDLLQNKDQITDVKDMMGDHTAGGIHVVKWKSFVLNPENSSGKIVNIAP